MLEYEQDKHAFPLKTKRMHISLDTMIACMKADAKKIAKRAGRGPKLPSPKPSGLAGRSKDERVLQSLASGPKTRPEIAEELGVAYQSAYDYMRPLLREGRIQRMGEGLKVEMFCLPTSQELPPKG